ncbi:uncharacterized protein JCM6883_001767 [Sporobolomyces salmoneus]|uniref:uncharacterized protein n=1 Tax=Sporobolomyces salmoneus TaxID=183962 RepID=UPI003173760E
MAFSFSSAPAANGALPIFGSNGPTFSSSSTVEPSSKPTQQRKSKINEEREFIVDSYPLFASLQRIVHEYTTTLPVELRSLTTIPPPKEQVQYYGRISSLYRERMLKQLSLVQANQRSSSEEKQSRSLHYSTMHSILSLTEILYFPSDGLGDGVVAEELLDWLNVVDRAPSTEEGSELSTLSQPWTSPLFFPYLTRCLLRGHSSPISALLSLFIESHPSNTVREIGKSFLGLFEGYPRSIRYSTEMEFRMGLKGFKGRARQVLGEVEKLYEELREGASEVNFEDEEFEELILDFNTLFSILTLSTTTNDEETALEVLKDQCETWQEYLISYLIYYAPLSTRQDLSTILSTVVLNSGQFSVDQTLLEEKVQERLFRGDITGLLKTLVTTDEGDEEEEEGKGGGEWLWLATHLIDLLFHLNLPAFDIPTTSNQLDSMEEEEGETEKLGPRETFLLSYADTLISSDSTLWRVACEYWGECGAIGRERIASLLSEGEGELVDQEEETAEEEGMDLEQQRLEKGSKKGRNVEEVLTVLGEYGMEEEVKKVCQVFAERLIEKKKYGKAIAYCVRAGDSKRVDRIGYRILDEYVDQGQESFISHVDSLPTSLLRPAPSSPDGDDNLESDSPPTNFQYPLITFLSRYRDFLALYSLASQKSSSSSLSSSAEELEEIWRLKRQSSELLILLLSSGMAPKKFWAIMLLDSIGLLESQPPLVSLAETYELLRIIEELTAPIELSASSSEAEDSEPIDVFGDLDMLGRLLEGQEEQTGKKKGEKKGGERTRRALSQLEIVRGALARHLAICCCL